MSVDILKKAQLFCETYKHRATEPRLAVLSIVAASEKPLGAYDILERLGKTIKNPKPPTVYRAIEFWAEHGFIHRIESINAYVTCEAGHQHRSAQFMVCNDCGRAIEAHVCELPTAFQEQARTHRFLPDTWSLEIRGRCGDCA